MNKTIVRAALLSASLALLNGSASAANFTVAAGTTDTAAKSLNAGQTGTVEATGKLSISGNAIAVEFKGNSTLTNSGTIETTSVIIDSNAGKNRTLRDNTGGLTLTITNNASGVIQTADADVLQMNVAGSTVTFNNYGTLNSMNASAGGNQALDFNALNTAVGGNKVYNFATGLIQASEADAIRPGVNGFIYNSGTIKSTTATGSSSDGIDLQTNITGVTITNAATETTGAGATNLIEGGRHGITGGQQIDSTKSGYDQAFVLSVTNKVGGTIKGDNGSGINIDGVSAKEVVTVNNDGIITGNGVTADGDGVDVDGLVILTNTGTIKSLNALNDTSEGVTVGGGSITNATTGVIQGSISTPSNNTGTGIGITLAGVDTSGTPAPIYDTTTVDNSGLIKGDSDSGIRILGGHSGFTTTITNQVGGVIQGGGTTNAVILTDADDVSVINKGKIEATDGGTAVNLGAGTNNSLQVVGGAATIIGDVSGSTGHTSTFTMDAGTGNSFTYAGKISNFSTVEVKSGHVTLSGASTYAGTTKVSGGVLSLGAANAVPAGSAVVLAGGTLDTAGFGAASTQVLSLQGVIDSVLDYGTGHSGSEVVAFADSHTAAWENKLNLANFTVGVDQLNFGNSTGLTSDQLGDIQLSYFTATGLDQSGNVIFASSPVPEPTAGLILPVIIALTGLVVWRRRQAAQV